MSYNVILTDSFKKEAKKLIKKYASLINELAKLTSDLENNPLQGTPLGNNTFKIRISIASKNKGKSGGARVISHAKIVQQNVYLISIYDKGEKETLIESEIQEIMKNEGLL